MFFSEADSIKRISSHKYPFHINGKIYMSNECYHEDKLMNGISLNLSSCKGIPNDPKLISFLTYSQRLVFYVGQTIMAYNSYKKLYQQLAQSKNLFQLKALSLRNHESEYIIWVERAERLIFIEDQQNDIISAFMNFSQSLTKQKAQKYTYKLCLYNMNKKLLIGSEDFFLDDPYDDIFMFVHPLKVIGFLIRKSSNTIARFKVLTDNQKQEFGEEKVYEFGHPIQKLTYNIETNEYIFLNEGSIYSLSVNIKESMTKKLQVELVSEEIIKFSTRSGKIVHFTINGAYLVLLTKSDEYQLYFYSLYTYELIFSQRLDHLSEELPNECITINRFQISANTIFLYDEECLYLCIWSVVEKALKFVKWIELELENCCRIEKLFINVYSSEVIVVSNHFQLDGNIRSCNFGLRNYGSQVYVDISIFNFALDSNVMPIKKMNLRKRKYQNILCCPWLGQYLLQTNNSIICQRWEERIQYGIKCSAIHPTGQCLVLGFKECFKVYYVAYEGLQNSFVSEIIKECVCVDYHPSGREFAVASNHIVNVYHCYTYAKLHQINITMSCKVKEILYEREGDALHLTTQNRRMHRYRVDQQYKEQFVFNPKSHLQTQKKSILHSILGFAKEIHTKSQNEHTQAIIYDKETKVVIFSISSKLYFLSIQNYESLGCFDFDQISCFYLYRPFSTLFMGTLYGDIICFPWPNNPNNITSKIPIYHCHNEAILNIKVTSDHLYLISITKSTIFKHRLAYFKNTKHITQEELEKENNSVIMIDLLTKKGLCLYTSEYLNEKEEKLKEFEEEAMNLNFILPEEREKQKKGMLEDLQTGQKNILSQNMSILQPLKQKTSQNKQKVEQTKLQLQKIKQAHKRKTEIENTSYEKKLSKLSEEREKIFTHRNNILVDFKQKLQKQKQQNQQAETNLRQDLDRKLVLKENQRSLAQFQVQKQSYNFFELSEIEEEKAIQKEGRIIDINEEIVKIKSRNGYLMSRNTNLEKQICMFRRKIEDTKDINENTTRSIYKLGAQAKKKQVVPESGSEMFLSTEKKYLEETKNLIEKNKAVGVNVALYEKERQILIALEKMLDKTERTIEKVVDDLTKERQERKAGQEKHRSITNKMKHLLNCEKSVKMSKTQLQNNYKDFKYQIALFLEKLISLKELREVSKITKNAADFKNCCEVIETLIQTQHKKHKIVRSMNIEDKLLSKIDHDEKIFHQEKKKLLLQNQDLLDDVNALSHRNKYLQNYLKTQEEQSVKEKKTYCITKKKKKEQRVLKPTPFENYIKFYKPASRRAKTNPCE